MKEPLFSAFSPERGIRDQQTSSSPRGIVREPRFYIFIDKTYSPELYRCFSLKKRKGGKYSFSSVWKDCGDAEDMTHLQLCVNPPGLIRTIIWWSVPVIPSLRKQRSEEPKCKVVLSYRGVDQLGMHPTGKHLLDRACGMDASRTPHRRRVFSDSRPTSLQWSCSSLKSPCLHQEQPLGKYQ